MFIKTESFLRRRSILSLSLKGLRFINAIIDLVRVSSRSGALIMIYNLVSIGYSELRSAFREIYRRSRQWHHTRSNWIHKKLLEACMDYTRKGFRITSGTILAGIRVSLKELRVKNGRLSILLDRETSAFGRIRIRNRDLTSDQTLSVHFNQTTFCK